MVLRIKKYKFTNALLVFLLFFMFTSKQSYSQFCVQKTDELSYSAAALDMSNTLTSFTQQESNYIKQSYNTLSFVVELRLEELRRNTINWLSDWAVNRLQPSMQDIMQQLSVNYMEQSLLLSKVIDAKGMSDHYLDNDKEKLDSYRRYESSASSGIIDTFGPGLIQGYVVSRASGYALLSEEMALYSNNKDTLGEKGRTDVLKSMWDDYRAYFCNPTTGGVGCDETVTPDVEIAGKEKDISQLLWGPNKSIDLSTLKNRTLYRYLLRFFVYPEVNNPIPKAAFSSATSMEEFLNRRADKARTNTIYHAVSQMLGDRIGGSSKMAAYTQEVRSSADVDINNIAANPSYREINETLNKDRFLMPDYFIDMSTKSAEQVLREQIALGAFRSQMMDDLYRRQEEMLLISAANYSRYLDDKIPQPPVKAISTGGASSD